MTADTDLTIGKSKQITFSVFRKTTEKMNGKFTLGTRAVKKGGGSCCSACIQYVAVNKVASVAFIVLHILTSVSYTNISTPSIYKYYVCIIL